MRSILVFLTVSICSINARPAFGQEGASPAAIELEIRDGTALSETCLTAQSLSARVAHYSAPKVRHEGLRLVLYITGRDDAELQILRGDSVLSRRSFTQLPAACADRRDAVALSIALALERSAAAPAVNRASVPAASGGDVKARRSSAARAAAASGTDAAAGGPDGAVAGGAAASSEVLGENRGEQSAASAARSTQPHAQADREDNAATTRANAPRSSARRAETADTTPVILGNLPTTTSRDPRRKGASESSLQLQLGGRITLEAVPAPVWVGALGVELPVSPSFTLGITALISSVGESALAGARARARFLGLEAVGCGNIALGAFLLQTCAGAAVALCEVSGRDYPRERPESTLLWAAVLGRATLRWPRAGFIAARLLLQPHVSISRPDLRVENSSEHLQSFWLGGTAGLELWLALP